jgi:hypothetical protein
MILYPHTPNQSAESILSLRFCYKGSYRSNIYLLLHTSFISNLYPHPLLAIFPLFLLVSLWCPHLLYYNLQHDESMRGSKHMCIIYLSLSSFHFLSLLTITFTVAEGSTPSCLIWKHLRLIIWLSNNILVNYIKLNG